MFTVDAQTLAALQHGADFSPIVTVLRGSSATVIPVLTAQSQVTYDIGSVQVRHATLSVDRSIVDAGLLDPLSDRVHIRLQVAGGTDIPLFVGRVSQRQETGLGIVDVSCIDHFDDINGDTFNTPWSTLGEALSVEVSRIVSDVDPTFGVDFSALGSAADQQVPILTWEEDRSRALLDILQGANGLIQSDRTGSFTTYVNPFYQPPTPPIAVFKNGVGGTIVGVTHITSRADIFNSITIIVERTDGTAPIRVTVRDNDPTSKTYYGGSFGKRNRNIKLQTPLDDARALQVGIRVLRQSLALSESWQWSTPCYPILDPGDVVAIWYRDVVSPVMIESVSLPLSANGATQFTGRRLQLLDPSLISIV